MNQKETLAHVQATLKLLRKQLKETPLVLAYEEGLGVPAYDNIDGLAAKLIHRVGNVAKDIQ